MIAQSCSGTPHKNKKRPKPPFIFVCHLPLPQPPHAANHVLRVV
jgi:hypothetical protein